MGIRARAKVRHGLVVEEILEEVHSEDYDLVVSVSWHGHVRFHDTTSSLSLVVNCRVKKGTRV